MKKILLLILLFQIKLFAQEIEISGSSKKDETKSKESSKTSAQGPFPTSITNVVTLEGAINSSEYKVGPGDIFGLSVSSNTPFSMEIIVIPEGSVLIPSVGSIKIDGLTLDKAKQKVINVVKTKYNMSDVNFELLVPRNFIVSVFGEVELPAIYKANATERVNSILAKAKHTKGSNRNIKVIHKNGTETFVDLDLYNTTRNSKYNPYLQDGDVIIVPKKQLEKSFIAIYGEVNFQGTFEYLESDKLRDLFFIAGNVTSTADLSNVEVARWNKNSQKDEIIKLDLLSDQDNYNFKLEDGDRVNVHSIVNPHYNYTVKIEGEISQPGIYPITKEATYLSEIVTRAKGFTKYASLNSSKIYRRQVSNTELEIEKLEGVRGNLAPEDIDYFNTETALRINREIVVVDFKKIFADKITEADVLLKPGDVISIPSTQKNVYVYGQVSKPGYIPLLKSNEVEEYIQFAGGYLENAKEDEIKIIKANTKEWVNPSETTIEDGDYIFVPKEPYRAPKYYFETFRDIAALTTSLATLYLMLQQIGK